MPQLDVLSYSTQIIWMIITFGILYKYIIKYVIGKVEEITKARKYKSAERKKEEGENKERKEEGEVKLMIEYIKEHLNKLNKLGTKDFKIKKLKQKNKKKLKGVKKKVLKEIVKKEKKIYV